MPLLLDGASKQAETFLDQFSHARCTEHVLQEKLGRNRHVENREESSFDYLAIMTNTGGELSVDESRLVLKQNERKPLNPPPLLVTNGFATLFLILHPYYQYGFAFTDEGEETVEGHRLRKVGFTHIHGSRSPAVLVLRGREFPLDLTGTIWLDEATAAVTHIFASFASSMEDIGMKTLLCEIRYAEVGLKNAPDVLFPSVARVEVETPRQHWRNTHEFSGYQLFSVSSEEIPAKP